MRATGRKPNPFRPFCSDRCKLLDLGAWLDGEFRLPGDTIGFDEIEQLPEADESDTELEHGGRRRTRRLH